jgi:XTP/dITP diphosphohydrolase
VASHNSGKVREIGELLAPYGVETVSAADLGLPEPEETGVTFAENAILKALAGADGAGLPALADDSGLVVPALDGQPGIYSARWAEGADGKRDFGLAMGRVVDELGERDKAAYFICALCLAWPDGHSELFEGRVAGRITWPMRGDKGFGYDPIFQPDGYDITFAEMEPGKKHAMSHRANAFRQLIDACFPDN